MKDPVAIKNISPFGRWLKLKRLDRGLTVRALAELTGPSGTEGSCSAGYISQLENGQYAGKKGEPMQPSEPKVRSLARALKQSANEALRLAKYPVLDESDEERIRAEFAHTLHNYQQLSPRARSFANRHFTDTINFLLDSEGFGEPEEPEDGEQSDELLAGEFENSEDDPDFDEDYRRHVENVREGKFDKPRLVVEHPTEEDISRIESTELPVGQKKRPPKDSKGD